MCCTYLLTVSFNNRSDNTTEIDNVSQFELNIMYCTPMRHARTFVVDDNDEEHLHETI